MRTYSTTITIIYSDYSPLEKGGQGAVPRWRGEGVVSHHNPSKSPFTKERLNGIENVHAFVTPNRA